MTIKATSSNPLSNDKTSAGNRQNHSFGVHGVRLKHFEQVVANVLPSVQPNYVCLPPIPTESSCQDWPFSNLPAPARVLGTNPGQLPKAERAARKEGQLRSMLRCILQLVPEQHRKGGGEPFTIVDFGGGSGHLGIPLALLLPHCRVIVVDLRKRSLDLMHEKAEILANELLQTDNSSGLWNTSKVEAPSYVKTNPAFRSCASTSTNSDLHVLGNLFSFHGPVEKYMESFDMALALHLCGEATDVTLRKAAAVQATAMVLAPCCVGKLSQKVLNPDVYHATGQNIPTVSYPQSQAFCQLIPHQDDWDALAKAADYSNETEFRTNRNATRRTAKALLETDRQLFLQGNFGYKTALMRMDPWEVTPKNDILVAWKPDSVDTSKLFQQPDPDCQADVEVSKSHLLQPATTASESSDWTKEEETGIRKTIEEFLEQTEEHPNKMEQVYTFPTRMGGRRRKLIHFVAGQLDLAHWSVGSKDAEKTVAVARRGQRKRKNPEQ